MNRFEDCGSDVKKAVRTPEIPKIPLPPISREILRSLELLNKPVNNVKKEEETESKEEGIDKYLELPEMNINSLEDLIKLSKIVNDNRDSELKYPPRVEKLRLIYEDLLELDGLVGLDDIKNKLVNQIIYLLSHCEENIPPMFHTSIEGPPGTGKTLIARIIGKIVYHIGYLKKYKKKNNSKENNIKKLLNNAVLIDLTNNNKITRLDDEENNEDGEIVKYVTRNDLVGGYLGQTAIKTQEAIDSASGGVLIIDEAYSLGGGRGDKTDSYSQECIDTLVSNLSENRSFMCIILGYPGELNEGFFKKNRGLDSRFPFRYGIEKYSNKELGEILSRKVSKDGYIIDKKNMDIIFEDKEYNNLGRDMEVLWMKIKMAQTRRTYLLENSINIEKDDIEEGMNDYNNDKEEELILYKSMFV